MKLIIHALAALWPLPTRTGPSPCQSADLPIRELAKSQPSASAQKANGVKRRPDERSDIGISASILNNKTIFHLDHRYCNVLAYMTLFMCLIAAYKAPAQTGAAANMDEIQPLQIGDTIPEELWHLPLQVVNHPEGKETITLNDYRGKLIILDFWATWCGSCIAAMPRIHEIEQENITDMVVIPVNREPANKVLEFLYNNQTIRHLKLLSVVNGEALQDVFPHQFIPYYVWISPSGDVASFTTAERVSAQNVRRHMMGKRDEIPHIRNISVTRPLFLSDVIEIDDLTYYAVFTKSKFDGLPSGNRFREVHGIIRGRAFTNLPILSMYQAVAMQLFNKSGDTFNRKKLILEVADTTGLIPLKSTSGETSNLYNYELIVPTEKADSLYYYLLENLNRYTQYHGRIEKRTVQYFTLTKTGSLDKIKCETGKPIAFYVGLLNNNKNIPLLVIDETGYTENVNLDFYKQTNIATLEKELNRQNLALTRRSKLISVFVISDRPEPLH